MPKQRPARPIESVELTISFRANRQSAAKIREAFPSTVLRNGGCEVKLVGEQPGEVADRARQLLDAVRVLVERKPNPAA